VFRSLLVSAAAIAVVLSFSPVLCVVVGGGVGNPEPRVR
jgi:hypothetical protein